MNIAMKNAKQKKRRTPQQMLLAGVMLFFFTAFLLLFVQSPSLLTAAMALLVPLAVWAMVRILPRLFPMDEFLLTLIAFLCALGVLLQYRYTPSRGLTQAFNCGAGLVAMVVCALAVRHIKSWRLLMVPLMGLSCAMMALPFVFRAVNAGKGATAWVGFGGFTIQPSELVKIVYLFVLSYLLSRRRIVTGMIFIGLMLGFLVPFQAILLSLFEVMQALYLLDSLPGMIAFYANGSALTVFLAVGYMRSIPRELNEAAIVDGAGPARIFFQIIFPLMKSITTTSIIFNTMWIWNDFIAPNIFLNSRANTTLVLEVFRAKGQFTTNWPIFMTLSVVTIFPIFIFYCFMQKHIIQGLTAGAVKG